MAVLYVFLGFIIFFIAFALYSIMTAWEMDDNGNFILTEKQKMKLERQLKKGK